jgi:alpha-beta hydrolase superfamily lysophospholipase
MSEQDTEQLRRDIARTRAELGATVEALSHKADLKAQARAKAEQAKAQARERAELVKVQAREKAELARSRAQENPAVPLAAGIGGAIVALWVIRRRKRR